MSNSRKCRECNKTFEYAWKTEQFRRYCDEHVNTSCKNSSCSALIKRNGRTKYCSELCQKRFSKTGDRLRNNPEEAKRIGKLPKPNHGLKGYKQSEEHLIKRLGSGAIRASKEELSLVDTLGKLGFEHTGEGSFWRRWPDGTIHNPDFVNHEKRVVVEYFGSYWHQEEIGREDYIVRSWKEIGYDCLIIWDHERSVFLQDPIAFGMVK